MTVCFDLSSIVYRLSPKDLHHTQRLLDGAFVKCGFEYGTFFWGNVSQLTLVVWSLGTVAKLYLLICERVEELSGLDELLLVQGLLESLVQNRIHLWADALYMM